MKRGTIFVRHRRVHSGGGRGIRVLTGGGRGIHGTQIQFEIEQSVIPGIFANDSHPDWPAPCTVTTLQEARRCSIEMINFSYFFMKKNVKSRIFKKFEISKMHETSQSLKQLETSWKCLIFANFETTKKGMRHSRRELWLHSAGAGASCDYTPPQHTFFYKKELWQ